MAADLYPLHKLLWALRNDPEVPTRFRADPHGVSRGYGVPEDQLDALTSGRLRPLYDLGPNPYLLYFGALQSGMGRDEYYAALRLEHPDHSAESGPGEQES